MLYYLTTSKAPDPKKNCDGGSVVAVFGGKFFFPNFRMKSRANKSSLTNSTSNLFEYMNINWFSRPRC